MSLASGPGRGGSSSQLPDELQLTVDAHVKYIQTLNERKEELDYWYTEHLRMNGVYWGLNSLFLMGRGDALPRDEVVDWVLSCQHQSGGFGAAPGHDAHMLSTVSAVQILALLDAFDELEKRGFGKQKVAEFIASLQNRSTGHFTGDEWGEEDTRFLYGALNALSLLHLIEMVDVAKAVSYVQLCANSDGGYGAFPGAESHAAHILTCIAALAIAEKLETVNVERLAAFLSERQTEEGGLNGRPEKLADVCYSWWAASSLAMIGRLDWINEEKLTNFILKCQDTVLGGIADRPGDMVDVFHTCFGIGGLSLIGYPGLEEVDPRYCMPKKITDKVLAMA